MTSDADLLSDARRRLPQARKNLQAALGDMPSRGGAEGVSGGGTGEWGPTVTIALALGRDEAVRDSRRLDTLMLFMAARCRRTQSITNQLAEVIDICDRWAPTARRRQAIDTNLRAAADDLLNRHDDHGNCRSCTRVKGVWGEPHRQGLCKTCARHLDRIHNLYDVELELPPRILVEVCKTRGKVTDHDIYAAMHGNKRRET